MAIKHVKVATVPDDGISEVGTDEWNDDHTIDNGTITNDQLSATGTKDSSTYLRGDGSWSQISGIPSGVILMWSGSLASIPAGWNLCDGSNGTPNLIAKFVRSIATSSTEAGSTGGSDAVTLTGAQSGTSAHGHGGSTSTTGSHTHTGSTSTAGDHGHTGSTNSTGAHTHSITEGNNYSGYDGVDNRLTDRSPASGNQTYMYTGSNGNHSHTVTINNA